MPITIQQFRTRYPQWSDSTAYPDAYLDDVIQEASRCVADAFFGNKADDARLYLSAHILVMTSRGRGEGVAAGAAGPASVAYRSAPENLDLTGYGQQFKRLVRVIGAAQAVI